MGDRINIPGTWLARVLLVAALVAVLLPACAGAVCGPTDPMHMDSSLSALLGCDSMYYPGDAPAGLILQALTLLFAAVAVALLAAMPATAEARGLLVAAFAAKPPHPPDDPLRGRLII